MKRTRKLFVLTAKAADLIPRALKEVLFKAVIVFDEDHEVTRSDILKTYEQNKNVVCSNISQQALQEFTPITIALLKDSSEKSSIPQNQPCIFMNQDIGSQFQKIADDHACDIGDHVSNSSGLTGAPSIADCAYCRYLADPTVEKPKTIYKNKDFFVYTTLGQFVPGYLLIIPVEHVMSIAELDPARKMEFIQVLNDARYILNLTYHTNNLLVWENGTGNSGKGKAKDSVVHAHVHVACSNLDTKQIQKISGFPFTSISFDELDSYGQHSYLLIKDRNDDNHWKINDDPNLYIPRQYIRQLLAEEYGIPGEQWNWRTYPFHELRAQATSDIYHALKSNWKYLPDRIKRNTQILMSTF